MNGSLWEECKQTQRCSVSVLFTFLQETKEHSEPGCILGFDDIHDFLILLLTLGALLLIVCQTLNQKNVANTIKNNGNMKQNQENQKHASNTIKNNGNITKSRILESCCNYHQKYKKYAASHSRIMERLCNYH